MNEQQKMKQEEEARMKEARRNLLSQVLTQEALGRLNNITLVKPEKGMLIENALLSMAQRGELRDKMDDDTLAAFIRRFVVPAETQTRINIVRKKYSDDSDDLEDY